MSNDENRNITLRWFDGLNQGDIKRLDQLADELFTADFIEHDPRMPNFEPGPAGVKKFIHQLFEDNSNVHVTLHDLISSGDKTAYRFTVSMTDKASRKHVHVQLLALTRFVSGQFAEEWQLSAAGKWYCIKVRLYPDRPGLYGVGGKMDTDFSARAISNDGTPIAYYRSGTGPPLVLVHGAGASPINWTVFPALTQHFTVYAVDRRGHGESGDTTQQIHRSVMVPDTGRMVEAHQKTYYYLEDILCRLT